MEEKGTVKDWIHHELLTVPNFLTLCRILGTGYLIIYLLQSGLAPITLWGVTSPWILPIIASGIVFTDMLDGFIARTFHCSSKLGGAMDAIADKIFNWGIALTLVFTGVMPLASLALLTPTIVRDLYVATVTTMDKTEDGLQKIKPNKTKKEKLTLKDKKDAFLDGDAMPPTIYGKLKMWPMSIAVISGLRYGYLLSQNLLFPVCALLSDACSLIDITVVHRHYQERKDQRLTLNRSVHPAQKEAVSVKKKNRI